MKASIIGIGHIGSATAHSLTIAGVVDDLLLVSRNLSRASADAREQFAKFKTVFAEQSEAADKFATSLAKSIGRSANDIRAGMTAFQGFFVGLGFGNEEARKFTQQLQSLSRDFAAFHNLEDSEAMERFISALSGSSEVLDKFGINTRQAALEQTMLERGIRKSWTATTEQEVAVARLDVIMRAMTDQGAVGAAVREADSLANQLKRLSAEVRDTTAAVREKSNVRDACRAILANVLTTAWARRERPLPRLTQRHE